MTSPDTRGSRLNLKTRLAIGGSVAVAAMAAGLFDKAPDKAKSRSDKTKHSQRYYELRAEKTIENNIENSRFNNYTARQDVRWSKGFSRYQFNRRTIVPIRREVRGEERYFRLISKGCSLDKIVAKIIPEPDFAQPPGKYSEDVLSVEEGVPNDEKTVISDSGVISLSRKCKPQFTLRYNTGETRNVNAGVTLIDKTNGPFVARR